jgi:ABC transporter substrate binding protein
VPVNGSWWRCRHCAQIFFDHALHWRVDRGDRPVVGAEIALQSARRTSATATRNTWTAILIVISMHSIFEPGRRMQIRLLGRRGFVAVLAGAAAWPRTGHTEQPERMRRVGVLLLWPENDPMARASVTAFAQALGRFGWIEGKNIGIDYRFAAGDPTRFKTYASELVGLMPDVLLAGASLAIAALRRQTRTIPIVFVNVSDPFGQGLCREPRATRRQHHGVHGL